MLLCTKCGGDNPLGRVFCGTCGAKLDLSRMTSQTVMETVKVNWFAVHWPKFAIGIGVIVVMVAALAFWPKSELLGEKGTTVGANRVGGMLQGLEKIPAGKAFQAPFPEKDINAYFEYTKQKAMKDVTSFSVDVQEGFVNVRVVRPIRSKMSLMGYDFEPRLSYDLTLVPFSGTLVPKNVGMGHLQMFGPLKGMVVRKIYGLLSAEKEWAAFKYTTELKVGHDTITVVCKR